MRPRLEWVLCGVLACSGEEPKDEGTGDDPTEADADADGDSDGDADGDSDTDSDSDSDLSCADGALGNALPLSLSGTTSGAGDDWSPACSSGDGEDVALSFVAPTTGRFLFDTLASSFDTVVYVLDGCQGDELACNDDYGGITSAAPADLAQGQGVIVVVDGFQESGSFELHVSEIPAAELSCEDGLDEDFDGKVDCLDPDCPPCGDCTDLSLGPPPSVASGSTVGALDDAIGSCDVSPSSSAPDVHVGFTAPSQGRYAFRLVEGTDFDSVLYVLDGCGGAELGCDDYFDAFGSLGGEVVTVELAATQTVVAVVDGFAGLAGAYELEVELVPANESTCDDGQDNDFDGFTDCIDTDCTGIGSCFASCPDVGLLGTSASGTTWGLPDETSGSCTTVPGAAPDVQIAYTAPADSRYLFALAAGTDFDTVLYVLDACGGAELACQDLYWSSNESVVVSLTTGQQVTAVVDGSQGQSGSYELVVAEVTADEVGLCSDNVDNDTDGWFDCGDPDCAAEPACGEICDDGFDDNGNGLPDCLDPTCASSALCAETCPENVLSGALPLQYAGNTYGAADNYTASCATNVGASDTTFTFTAPSAGTYTFDTVGSALDSLLIVLDGCVGVELACNDDIDVVAGNFQSSVQVALAAGQTVIVVVDGYSPWSADSYVLNVSL